MNDAMPDSHAPRLCYVTPTFGRDIERFALLRSSLRRFSPRLPHLVVVDAEDIGVFRERFASETNLELIASSAILPAKLERERRLMRSWRGRLIQRIGWRCGLNTRLVSGWKIQQILKLELVTQIPYDAVVFLDCDIVMCAPAGYDDYFSCGALRLLETRASSYEDYAFEISRQILVGGDLMIPANAFNYVHQAPRFLTRTAVRLKAHLQTLHRNWQRRFISEAFPSEYNLLGYAARELEAYRGYHVEATPPSQWVYNVKRREDLARQLALCREECGRRKFILVQSNLRMPESEYLPAVSAMLDEFAASPMRKVDPTRAA
jgi:hypothetical protein